MRILGLSDRNTCNLVYYVRKIYVLNIRFNSYIEAVQYSWAGYMPIVPWAENGLTECFQAVVSKLHITIAGVRGHFPPVPKLSQTMVGSADYILHQRFPCRTEARNSHPPNRAHPENWASFPLCPS